MPRGLRLRAAKHHLPNIILETIGQSSPPRRLDARERVPRAWRLRAAKHQHGVNAQLPQQHCSSNKSARSLSNRDIGLTVHEVVPAVPPRCRPTSPFLVLGHILASVLSCALHRCTLSVHVVCALHLCTSSMHVVCALHRCTLSVHVVCARCLCTLSVHSG